MGQLHHMDLEDPEMVSQAEDVVQWQTISRVCGDLGVSRALGDPDFKVYKNNKNKNKIALQGKDGQLTLES